MARTKITDNWDGFENLVSDASDDALRRMAADIERLSKMTAPHLTGALYSSVKHYKVKPLHWRISYGENSTAERYAVYQEFGARRDGSREVKNYSKPGTGAHFLENAGANVALYAPGTFKGAQAILGRGLL